MYLKIVFLLFCGLLRYTQGLKCYACSFSSIDSDQSCLNINDDTNIVDCTYKYCTILRQEFLDPPGTVSSFLRGCEQVPDYLNHEVSDDTFRTFYRACTVDLCNIGNGIQSVTGGTLDPNPQSNALNLLVPGTGAAAPLKSCLIIFAVVAFFHVFV